MRSRPLAEARAEFSKLVDLALKGEPQRVTRRGREAVVIVSEAAWARGDQNELGLLAQGSSGPPPTTFAELLIALGSIEGVSDILDDNDRPWRTIRPLGSAFVDDIQD